MNGSIRRLSAAAIAAVALASGVAGCGESDSSSSNSSASAAGAEPLTGTPIKIGTVCTCSGPQGSPVVKRISEAWVKWVNTNGGVNGHPVELVFVDDAGDATKAASLARRLVEEDRVKAIVGNYSLQGSALAGVARRAKVPIIGGPGQAPEEFTDPNVFPTGAGAVASVYNNVVAAKEAGKSKLAVFYCAEVPVCAQFPALVGNFTKAVGGMSVAASLKVSATAPSYAAPCLAAKKAKADASIIAAASAVTKRIIQQCVQQGFNALQLGGSGSIGHNDANSLGSEVLLITPQLGMEDTTTPAGNRFKEVIDANAPDIPESPDYSQVIGTPFAGLELFRAVGKSAKLSPQSTSADVTAGLYALKNETLGGLAGPITYQKGKPTFSACSFKTTYSDGKWAADPKPVCLPKSAVQSILASAR